MWQSAPEVCRRKILQIGFLFAEERVSLRDLFHDRRSRVTDSGYLEYWTEDQVR
jgi:hypothetical protein